MILATVLGIGLGLMQISPLAPIRLPARFVTRLLRNSPWLVILFVVMYVLPVEVRLGGGARVPLPDWLKATFAFALPVMGNISEILRGAVNSIPSGQWDWPKVWPSPACRPCAGSSSRNAFGVRSPPG